MDLMEERSRVRPPFFASPGTPVLPFCYLLGPPIFHEPMALRSTIALFLLAKTGRFSDPGRCVCLCGSRELSAPTFGLKPGAEIQEALSRRANF